METALDGIYRGKHLDIDTRVDTRTEAVFLRFRIKEVTTYLMLDSLTGHISIITMSDETFEQLEKP